MSFAVVRDVDWDNRTSGEAVYATDFRLPGMLEAGLLRSPHKHARIRRIDTQAAWNVEGVQAVVTAEDVPAVTYRGLGGVLSDRFPLARGTVRFVGEEIAAVAAEDLDQVHEALNRIDVRYKRLPDVDSVEEALDAGSVQLHSAARHNVGYEHLSTYGDVTRTQEGTAGASVIRSRYFTGRHTHACMETHCVVAQWSPDRSKLDLWAPTQSPANIRDEVAHILGLRKDQVRVHALAVGGDFGSRVKAGDLEVTAAVLANVAGRPVKLKLSRAEEFAFTKSRYPFDVRVEIESRADGRLRSINADLVSDIGAYSHVGAADLIYAPIVLGSMYAADQYAFRCRGVYTNHRPPGSFRGAGVPAATFARECAMDELAEHLNLDPIDLRLRNVADGAVTGTTGWHLEAGRLTECLRRARDLSEWDAKRQSRQETVVGIRRGIGIAAAVHVTGWLGMHAGAAVDIYPDGAISVRTSCSDPGTGQKSVLAAVAAQELGVAIDSVDVLAGDTGRAPFDPGAGASRGTYLSGNAVGKAAATAAASLRATAGKKFGVPPESVQLSGGYAMAGDDQVTLGDLAALAEAAVDGVLTIEEEYRFEADADNDDHFGDVSPAYSFAVQVAEVEVDTATGSVRVERITAVHDAGAIINPTGARGQVVGGIAMGLGAALTEELILSHGRVANAGYVDYALPRANDVPPIDLTFLEGKDESGRYGSKGVAEISLAPTAAAVANAVADAVGVRVRSLPMTPDKVLKALHPAFTSEHPMSVSRRPRRWEVELLRRLYPLGVFRLLDQLGTRFAREDRSPLIEGIEFPDTIAGVSSAIAPSVDSARILAGGTDLLPAKAQGLVNERRFVDVTGCPDLRGITTSLEGELLVGSAVTLANALEDPALGGLAVVREAIQLIASPQIRAVATIGGNLCQQNRCWYFRRGYPCYKRGGSTCPCYAVNGDHRHYHAAMDAHRCQAVTPSDLATALAALDSEVLIRRGSGQDRRVPLLRFYKGPGEPCLENGEFVSAISIPASSQARCSVFEKLSMSAGGFALVSVGASLNFDDMGKVSECRIVLGGVAPTPRRLIEVERQLVGFRVDPERTRRASIAWLSLGHPLSDNAWKLDAASGMVDRAIGRAARSGRHRYE